MVAGGGLLLDGSLENWRVARGQAAAEHRAGAEQIALVATGLQATIIPLVNRPDLTIALEDLPPDDRARAETAVAAAMHVYPPGFLHRLIDRVALAGNIQFWSNQEVGGFFFPRGIVLNCHGMDEGFIRRTFHHELSSLVRVATGLDETRWMAANPPGFTYLPYAQYQAMLRDGLSDQTAAPLYTQGFVRAYGKADLDDDWNTYAERVFTDGKAFAALIKDYPRMRIKTRLLLDAYAKLDPRLEGYFERTGLRQATGPEG
jgi:hypothetical protein